MSDMAGRLEAAMAARARKGVRRAGLLLASALLFLVAVAFLTVALWIVTAAAYSAEIAALVIAGLYLAAGGVLLLMARSPGQPRVDPAETAVPPGHSSPYPAMAEAFVFGLDTALRLRRSRRDR